MSRVSQCVSRRREQRREAGCGSRRISWQIRGTEGKGHAPTLQNEGLLPKASRVPWQNSTVREVAHPHLTLMGLPQNLPETSLWTEPAACSATSEEVLLPPAVTGRG